MDDDDPAAIMARALHAAIDGYEAFLEKEGWDMPFEYDFRLTLLDGSYESTLRTIRMDNKERRLYPEGHDED